jgi:hypothetical protein
MAIFRPAGTTRAVFGEAVKTITLTVSVDQPRVPANSAKEARCSAFNLLRNGSILARAKCQKDKRASASGAGKRAASSTKSSSQ